MSVKGTSSLPPPFVERVRLCTPEEVAQIIHVHPGEVLRMIKAGTILARKKVTARGTGKKPRWLIAQRDVRRYLESLPTNREKSRRRSSNDASARPPGRRPVVPPAPDPDADQIPLPFPDPGRSSFPEPPRVQAPRPTPPRGKVQSYV